MTGYSVLVIDRKPELFARRLQDRFAGQCTFTYCRNPDELNAALAKSSFDIVFSIGMGRGPRNMVRQAYESPDLKWMQIGGSGYEHILPLDRPDVTVTNAVGVLAPFLAETIMGAILARYGHFFTYREQQKSGVWLGHDFRPVLGQTLLIVGLGAIGQELAQRAKAFGMTVLATRRTPSPQANVDEVIAHAALDDALPRADIVSVHLRLDRTTEKLFNAKRFALMKPGSLFINTSRGGVADTQALVAALDAGQIDSAYLDVFETEPLPPEDPLWRRDDVFITPHHADSIEGWTVRFSDYFSGNLARVLKGQAPDNWVAGPQSPDFSAAS